MLKDFDLEQAAVPLLTWFRGHARILPWRSEPTPYRVWVSEIMLQQTRVEAVKPYFERFVKALPDVRALAECPDDKLLKLWEGLGYYNRVRNMQKAAVRILEEYNGELPSDFDELLTLKGIGRYTAGAVASIAYGKCVPVVDGNVLRVVTRLAADDTDITKQSFRNEVERELLSLLQRLDASGKIDKSLLLGNLPGTLNQAWMELGATVCLPNGEPLCTECPCHAFCEARILKKVCKVPVKSKAKARKIERRTVLIICDGNKVALHKRPGKGLLAGLYELPNVEGALGEKEVLSLMKEMKYSPIRIWPLEDAKHIFSHIEWHMKGFAVRIEESGFAGEGGNEEEGLIFADIETVKERYAIPSAFAAYERYLNLKLVK